MESADTTLSGTLVYNTTGYPNPWVSQNVQECRDGAERCLKGGYQNCGGFTYQEIDQKTPPTVICTFYSKEGIELGSTENGVRAVIAGGAPPPAPPTPPPPPAPTPPPTPPPPGPTPAPSPGMHCDSSNKCWLPVQKCGYIPRIDQWNYPNDGGKIIGSFVVIGDWGWDEYPYEHGSYNGFAPDDECVQVAIGGMISQFIDNPSHGYSKSVIAIGDNFYSRGLDGNGVQYHSNDNGWNEVWRRRMGRAANEDVAWYAVYGNHDFGQKDNCICGSGGDINKAPQVCSQVLGHKNPDTTKGGRNWYMPHLMYSVNKDGAVGPDGKTKLDNGAPPNDNLNYMPEVELVALETNYADAGMICTNDPNDWRTSCPGASSIRNLNRLSSEAAAINHLKARIQEDPNKLRIVFQHYPAVFQALQKGTSSNGQQEWFGGHTHENIPLGTNANGNNWMVGGSGGWGLEGGLNLGKAGFAVVFVMEKDGKRYLKTKLQTVDDQGNYNPFQNMEMRTTSPAKEEAKIKDNSKETMAFV